MALPNFVTEDGEIIQLSWNRLRKSSEFQSAIPSQPSETTHQSLDFILGLDGSPKIADLGISGIGFERLNRAIYKYEDRSYVFPIDRPWSAGDFDELRASVIAILDAHEFPTEPLLKGIAIFALEYEGFLYWSQYPGRFGELINMGPELSNPDQIGSSLADYKALFSEYWPPHSAFRWAFAIWPSIVMRQAAERDLIKAGLRHELIGAVWNSAFRLGQFLQNDFVEKQFGDALRTKHKSNIKNKAIGKKLGDQSTAVAHEWYRAFGNYMAPIIREEEARLGRALSRSDAAAHCHNEWPAAGFETKKDRPAVSTVEKALAWLESPDGGGSSGRGTPRKGRRQGGKK